MTKLEQVDLVLQHVWRFHHFSRDNKTGTILILQRGDRNVPSRWVTARRTVQDATALLLGNEATPGRAEAVLRRIRIRVIDGNRATYPVD